MYLIGFLFAYWLLYQSMFNIGALCPWCMLVTVSTTLVFFTLTHVNIRDGNLFLPPRTQAVLRDAVNAGFDAIVVTIWLLILTLVIVLKYGAQLFA